MDDREQNNQLSTTPISIKSLSNNNLLSTPPTPSSANNSFDYVDHSIDDIFNQFYKLNHNDKLLALNKILPSLTIPQVIHANNLLAPRLKRDFLKELPLELSLHILSYINHPKTLARCSQVSKWWRDIVEDENNWKDMCFKHRYKPSNSSFQQRVAFYRANSIVRRNSLDLNNDHSFWTSQQSTQDFSYKKHFKHSYLTESNWRKGGRLISSHVSPEDAVVTSLVMDDNFIIIGMSNSNIHIFDALTGRWKCALQGHVQGVWCWGQNGTIVVSGSCDRHVRVWDAESGLCLHTLSGHTSTIRCVKVVPGKPIAVSGSRDATLRVWNIENGNLIHVLQGHQHSVRSIDVSGDKIVSGSYDCTSKLWDLNTGECLHTFEGHAHQIYSIAFNGELIATGSMDNTVRIWSASQRKCLAMLQGHTALIGTLQLTDNILVTGGSDGRVIVFNLDNYECLHRIDAHSNSVTSLQFDERFIVSAGNDGRIKLWDFETGKRIRDLSERGESIWRLAFTEEKCVILSRRNEKTVMELFTYLPLDDEVDN
ncbi:WD40 repeat-like protein [Wallemia mellicola CBS 633.66]|uniref:WD40 repeat-like protein n=1 Tax=Wallemia mellicola (strain ATCC MYA-4683 / CBS 633.66) TaxID=671144 RepID=I4YBQ6_WALMC|nr:WD40 repeat-like protein [Wallemia mellicola CBS 633.66]EIM21398.1 WD40 repeat-like protein [Wallemia mellicola CBS 633.66]|eukprot:XP_006958421.1 WD40 repeat-like protein [Wallemia mellicola CBS 633.66]